MISEYLANKILDAVFNNTSVAYANVYISLHTASPAKTGADELTGGSYVRKTSSAAEWDAAATGEITTVTEFEWTELPAATITHVGVWDASTAGNFLWEAALTESVVLPSGSYFRINPGSLTASIDK